MFCEILYQGKAIRFEGQTKRSLRDQIGLHFERLGLKLNLTGTDTGVMGLLSGHRKEYKGITVLSYSYVSSEKKVTPRNTLTPEVASKRLIELGIPQDVVEDCRSKWPPNLTSVTKAQYPCTQCLKTRQTTYQAIFTGKNRICIDCVRLNNRKRGEANHRRLNSEKSLTFELIKYVNAREAYYRCNIHGIEFRGRPTNIDVQNTNSCPTCKRIRRGLGEDKILNDSAYRARVEKNRATHRDRVQCLLSELPPSSEFEVLVDGDSFRASYWFLYADTLSSIDSINNMAKCTVGYWLNGNLIHDKQRICVSEERFYGGFGVLEYIAQRLDIDFSELTEKSRESSTERICTIAKYIKENGIKEI
ncbi:hypothetical protein [Endozoicomonas sp. ALB032]|uniref:hypothetical protein n=1 Tax=Endozoicomonas sp. ALB032 TaxID=3403082 RepID=UPI003BB7CABE